MCQITAWMFIFWYSSGTIRDGQWEVVIDASKCILPWQLQWGHFFFPPSEVRIIVRVLMKYDSWKKRVDQGDWAKKRGECLSDSKASVSTDGMKSQRPQRASHEQCKWMERSAIFIFQLPKIFLSLPEIAKRCYWSWKIDTLGVSYCSLPKWQYRKKFGHLLRFR